MFVTISEKLIIFAFGLWALLSVTFFLAWITNRTYPFIQKQFGLPEAYGKRLESLFQALKSIDKLNLLVRWSFFSDESGHFDLYLCVRGIQQDCTFTEWTDITPKGRMGKVRPFYAGKQEFRAIRRSMEMVLPRQMDQPSPGLTRKQIKPDNPRKKIASPSYQLLLRYVKKSFSDQPPVERCQFLIATSEDCIEGSPGSTVKTFTLSGRQPLFLSPFHLLN